MLTATHARKILQEGWVLRISETATGLDGSGYNLNDFGARNIKAAAALEYDIEENGTLPDAARDTWQQQLDSTIRFSLESGAVGRYLLLARSGATLEALPTAERYRTKDGRNTFPKVNSVRNGFVIVASHKIAPQDNAQTLADLVLRTIATT